MTSPRRKSSKPLAIVPPTADMVKECPPHHWLVVSGRQTCKKCSLEQAVPAMTDTRTTTWQRRTAEKGGSQAEAKIKTEEEKTKVPDKDKDESA